MANEPDAHVLETVLEKLPKYGLELVEIRSEDGGLVIRSASGAAALINLANVTEYYTRTGDEKALDDFVARIAAALTQDELPDWKDAREHIYYAMHPRTDDEVQPPLARQVTPYCVSHLILESPTRNEWITPKMLERWGVTEEEARQTAEKNGERLLEETKFSVESLDDGIPIGQFDLEDETLNAALRLAPSLGERVGPHFGWPLYAVIPNKRRFCLFRKEDFEQLQERIIHFVIRNYDDNKFLSPELLQVGPSGIRAVEVLIDVYEDDEDDEDE